MDPDPGALEETEAQAAAPTVPPRLPSPGSIYPSHTHKDSSSSGISALKEPGTCLGTIWLPELLLQGRGRAESVSPQLLAFG